MAISLTQAPLGVCSPLGQPAPLQAEFAMYQSQPFEIAGVFVGAVVRFPAHFRFVAMDPRLEDLDLSDWPTLADIRRVATYLLTTGRLPARVVN